MIGTKTLACPKCGHQNDPSAVNCSNCRINLARAQKYSSLLSGEEKGQNSPTMAYEPKAASLSIKKASFWRRLFAFIMDITLLSFINTALSAFRGNLAYSWIVVAVDIFVIAIPIVYFALPYSISGQTIGKMLLGIRVLSLDGTPLNWRKGIIRCFGYIISYFPGSLGFLWSIWDADKQTWHDKMAGTCVVESYVTREMLQGTIEPAEVQRRQKRWLLGLGIPSLVLLIFGGGLFLIFIRQSIAEVNEMGAWPGYEFSPQEIIPADLSQLGLELDQTMDARDEKIWGGGSYQEGVFSTYKSGDQKALYLWSLKYADRQPTMITGLHKRRQLLYVPGVHLLIGGVKGSLIVVSATHSKNCSGTTVGLSISSPLRGRNTARKFWSMR